MYKAFNHVVQLQTGVQFCTHTHTHTLSITSSLIFCQPIRTQPMDSWFLLAGWWSGSTSFVFNFDRGASKRSFTPHALCSLLQKPLKIKVFRSEGYCPHVLCVSLSDLSLSLSHLLIVTEGFVKPAYAKKAWLNQTCFLLHPSA